MTNPDGSQNSEQYGTLYSLNDGRLLGKSIKKGDILLREEKYTYLTDTEAANTIIPSIYGNMLYPADPSSAKIRPIRLTEVIQDGISYKNYINSYDEFSRPTSNTASNNHFSRTYVDTYYDNTSEWILGQLSRSVNSDTDKVEKEITYGNQAQPENIKIFGKLKQTLTYNTDGTLATITDGNNHTTKFSAWKRGIPQSITNADGTTQSAIVDNNGWITSITDEVDATTDYTYDVMGRLTSIDYPGNDNVAWNPTIQSFAPINSVEHGLSAGHWRQMTITGNAHKEVYFDALWRPVVTREYDNADVTGTQRLQRMEYDHAGREIFASYPGNSDNLSTGVWTEYDALGRATSVVQDSEQGLLVAQTAYLPDGLTQATDPLGRQTTTSYQAFDQPDYSRPISIQKPEGVYLDITRDVFGKPLAITQHNWDNTQAVVRRYVYDGYQQLCKSIEPETGSIAMDYDMSGNLIWSAAGLSLPDAANCDTDAAYASGRRVDRIYDARNRLKTLVFPDGNGNQDWNYRADGKPAQIITYNDSGSFQSVNTYAYNKRGLLTAETSGQAGAYTWSLGYGYDVNGFLAGVQYPSGLYVDYAPNALGQPTRAGTYATGVSYFPNGGMRQFTYGNGIIHALTQNSRQLPDHVADTNVLDNIYSYDAVGNVIQIDDVLDATRTRSLIYDGLNRLIQATAPAFMGSGVLHYSYDALDNLRSAKLEGKKEYNYWYDASNRLTNVLSDSGATLIGLSYDAQGNLANKNGQAFAFDYGNRLRTVGGMEYYRYDAHGRRVVNGSSAGGDIISMYGQDGLLRRQENKRTGNNTDYIYLNSSMIAKVNETTTPAAPALDAPSYTSTGSYIVSWNAVTTATRYELQEQANGGDWTTVKDDGDLTWSANGKSAGQYAYRISACRASFCSSWSATKITVVELPPAAVPSLYSPAQSLKGSYLVSWSEVAGATAYPLEESFNGNPWNEIQNSADVKWSASDKSVGSYSYRISACNAAGCGPQSAVVITQVIQPPASAPVLSVPFQSLDGTYPISWSSVGSATSYRLEENANSNGWTQILESESVTTTLVGKGYGGYSYRVRACNAAGCSPYSSAAAITVILIPTQAPTLTMPSASNNGSYTISWTALGCVIEYRLEEQIGTIWTQIQADGSTLSMISGRASGPYGYRVRGCNASGCGPYSNTGTIAVLLAPTTPTSITAPVSSATGVFNLAWSSVAFASSYTLQESSDNGTTWHDYFSLSVSNLDVAVNNEGWTSSQNRNYRVNACNTTGCSEWSPTVTVQILPPPLPVPTGFTVNTSRNACTAKWNSVTGATRYEVYETGVLAQSNAFTSYRTDLACSSAHLQVRACNDQVCSAFVGG